MLVLWSVNLKGAVKVDHLSMDAEAPLVDNVAEVKASISVGTVNDNSHHMREVQ